MNPSTTNRLLSGLLAILLTGCAVPHVRPQKPSVAPSTQPAGVLDLGYTQIRPMYQEVMAIDLPTVSRVAIAQSLDIQQAQQRVALAQGQYETRVEALFPVIAPAFSYQHLEGVNQSVTGTLVAANFNNLLPAVTVQWIVNPGAAIYDIVAARKRLEATHQQADATELETLRLSANQYLDLVLAQAEVAAAQHAVEESEEALRLTTLRVQAAAALPSEQMRAKASLAGRRQDLLLAVNAFYNASLALGTTLNLDPRVTLVPGQVKVAQMSLVREDLPIDALLDLAVRYRPDLAAARTLLAAAESEKNAVVWGALGPQLQAAYQYGSLQAKAEGQTFHFQEQQKASASVGFAFGATIFGRSRSAKAEMRSVAIQAERRLTDVRTQVVAAQQSSLTTAAVIPIAREQLEAAEESLRLSRANLQAGTGLLLDVLQAEDELNTARVRHARAMTRFNQSQVNLIAALGLLDGQSLAFQQ